MRASSRTGPVVITISLLMALVACAQDDSGFSAAETPEKLPKPTGSSLFTNVYQVPPSFIDLATRPEASHAADPFAEPGKGAKIPRYKTTREILEDVGIEFGLGATAIYSSRSSQIVIRNTEDQLELVEAYFESLTAQQEKGIRLRLEIFDGDSSLVANLIRKHDGDADQGAALEEVLKAASHEFRHVASMVSSLRSAQRGKTESGYWLPVVRGYGDIKGWSDVKVEGVHLFPAFEPIFVGTKFEADPLIGADERSIELSYHLEHHFDLPEIRRVEREIEGEIFEVEAPRLFKGNLSGSIVMMDGHTRILGVLPVLGQKGNKVAGGNSRIVFLTAKIWRSDLAQKIFDERDLEEEGE